MSTVTVITPWLDHPELVSGYAQAVAGADQVIVVLNGGDPEMFAGHDFLIHQPGQPLGFSASNNRGLAFADGEVVVFLNNDVEGDPAWIDQVRAEVEPGALYGPAADHREVDGVRVPYVEGWCVAAHREVWGQLGGWDTGYVGWYWEDVDLSFRAMTAGLRLVRTRWRLRHLSNTTSATTPGAYAYSERNRAHFEARVRAHLNREVPDAA